MRTEGAPPLATSWGALSCIGGRATHQRSPERSAIGGRLPQRADPAEVP